MCSYLIVLFCRIAASEWDLDQMEFDAGDLISMDAGASRRRWRQDLLLAWQQFEEPWQRRKPLVANFDPFSLPEEYIPSYFRFKTAADIELLAHLLQMPDEMKAANGTKASGIVALIHQYIIYIHLL